MSSSPIRLSRRAGPRAIRVSFEFFPPKTDEAEATLWESIERLAPLKPDFVSVTYGAGGSTRERTHATVARIVRETALKPAAHLTCVGASRDEIDAVLAATFGAPASATSWRCAAIRRAASARPTSPHPDGYQSTADLWRHQSGRRLRHLRLRLSGEASREPVDFEPRPRRAAGKDRRRRDPRDHAVLLRQRRLLPLSRPGPLARDRHPDHPRHRAGAELPADRQLRRSAAAPAFRNGWPTASRRSTTTRPRAGSIAAAVAAEQVIDLLDRGVRDFHFYTMNRADLVYAICHLLGLRPEACQAAALSLAMKAGQ